MRKDDKEHLEWYKKEREPWLIEQIKLLEAKVERLQKIVDEAYMLKAANEAVPYDDSVYHSYLHRLWDALSDKAAEPTMLRDLKCVVCNASAWVRKSTGGKPGPFCYEHSGAVGQEEPKIRVCLTHGYIGCYCDAPMIPRDEHPEVKALEKVAAIAKIIDEKWDADETTELEQCELLLNLHDALAELKREDIPRWEGEKA